MADDLNVKLKAAAESLVGTKAVMKSGYGKDCFVLVDMLLRQLGAATAEDGDVEVTPTADYDWGEWITLSRIQPGDILQFNKHFITIVTVTKKPTETVTDTRTQSRPHHTAIVVAVHNDGSVTVVEQNVHPNPNTVNKNVIPRLATGKKTKETDDGDDEIKTTITVSGEVNAYRPIAKPEKGASLHPGKSAPAGGTRTLPHIPSQGGTKRVPGPIGMDVRQPEDERLA